jgi:hypothetical protein
MFPHPDHIIGYVNYYPELERFLNFKLDNYHIPYNVICNCQNDEFIVLKDDRPYVNAKCSKCNNEIIVYDLSKYPAAADISTDQKMVQYLSSKGDSIFRVFIVYEYSDEFSFDHKLFNNNDITACAVYGEGSKSKDFFEIINDETA